MANRRDVHSFFFETLGGEGDEESAPIIARHLKNTAIQISGTFEADVSVMTRIDPALDFSELAALTAPGFVFPTNDASMHDYKVVIDNYVSGTVVAKLVGRTSQE